VLLLDTEDDELLLLNELDDWLELLLNELLLELLLDDD